MAGPMMMMPLNDVWRTNQEVPLIFTRALQWKHTTVAVQMTLALTGTHSNALLTISLLTNRYIFTVHLYTVHIKKLCCICWKRKTFCSCYCLRLTEFCKRRIGMNWTTMSYKNKYRSSTSHNKKRYIFSYNNISSTIRALLIGVRFKKGFHEIICHSDVL